MTDRMTHVLEMSPVVTKAVFIGRNLHTPGLRYVNSG